MNAPFYLHRRVELAYDSLRCVTRYYGALAYVIAEKRVPIRRWPQERKDGGRRVRTVGIPSSCPHTACRPGVIK